MIFVDEPLCQTFANRALSAAVRGVLGQPLRRAAPLTQLACIGALSCLPAPERHRPSALLWQSTSGPRAETEQLLDEMIRGTGEPMPTDFLDTQPAIAAAQLQPFLPGLRSATHWPLAREHEATWVTMLALADIWLNEGRFERVLCAQLDRWSETATGQWLSCSAQRLETSRIRLQVRHNAAPTGAAVRDRPELPADLAGWLRDGASASLNLNSPAIPRLTVEFARL